MKKVLLSILLFILFVWGLAIILWWFAPEHEAPVIYACKHALAGCDDGSAKIYSQAGGK